MAESLPSSLVRDLKALENAAGRVFASVLLLRKLTSKTASNGNPFLGIEFGDRTGSFACTVFNDHPQFELLRGLSEGAAIRIEGRIDHYQGRFSPKLAKIAVLNEQELSAPGVLENLVEVPPEEPAVLWNEFDGYIESIQHPELRATVRHVFEEIGETFRQSPAAVSMHHAYRHGLLEHTTHMARAARALFSVYPEVDPELAMAGILLHDTGKTIEYEGTLTPRRSRRGVLQGHVVLGYQLVRKAGLKAKLQPEHLERLEHIILSHQGEPQWGAAVYAATPEAVFVSMIDNLDAKMGMVQRALRQGTENDEFSDRLPGLCSPLLLKKLGRKFPEAFKIEASAAASEPPANPLGLEL